MPFPEFLSRSEADTRRFGFHLGEALEAGMVVGLSGTLGSGKTALCRGIVAGLGGNPEEVVSPTFALCVPYTGRHAILHVDTYRMADDAELDELGLDEQVEWGAVLIAEWPERVAAGLPPLDLQIRLTPTGEQERRIDVAPVSERGRRWLQHLSPISGSGMAPPAKGEP